MNSHFIYKATRIELQSRGDTSAGSRQKTTFVKPQHHESLGPLRQLSHKNRSLSRARSEYEQPGLKIELESYQQGLRPDYKKNLRKLDIESLKDQNSPQSFHSRNSTGFFSSRQVTSSGQRKNFYALTSRQMEPQAHKLLGKLDQGINGQQLEKLYGLLKASPKQYTTNYQKVRNSNQTVLQANQYDEDQKISMIINAYEKPDEFNQPTDFKSPFQIKVEAIKQRAEADRNRPPMTFNKLLELNHQKPQVRKQSIVDNIDDKQLYLISQQLDPMLSQWQSLVPKTKKPTGTNMFAKKTYKKNFIEENIHLHSSLQYKNRQVAKANPALFIQNIPKLMAQTHLSRYEIYNTYSLYKALQQILAYRTKGGKFINGIDFDTFCAGIPHVNAQSRPLAEAIFKIIDNNFSGLLNWEEFLKLMSKIRARSVCDRIDLFTEIADRDKSGTLTWDEIKKFCRIQLVRYLPQEDSKDLLNHLCGYFTQFVFDCLGKTYDQSISFAEIKQAIREERKGWEHLCLFCGADT